MNEILKQKLAENGVDVPGTIHRFMGNEALWMKFLVRLKDDQNFTKMKENLEQENVDEAFKAAHAIKGVSANLGLEPVTQAASALTELFRGKAAGEVDWEEVKVQRTLLEENYELFVALIEEYQ